MRPRSSVMRLRSSQTQSGFVVWRKARTTRANCVFATTGRTRYWPRRAPSSNMWPSWPPLPLPLVALLATTTVRVASDRPHAHVLTDQNSCVRSRSTTPPRPGRRQRPRGAARAVWAQIYSVDDCHCTLVVATNSSFHRCQQQIVLAYGQLPRHSATRWSGSSVAMHWQTSTFGAWCSSTSLALLTGT
eukprot:SAG31_NODE_2556_length_5495_cov_27.724055_4_plen_188_part_00